MEYKIYYRKSLMEQEELSSAKKYFNCVSLLTDIQKNDIVIPRYSYYPFPLDQEKEILNVGATPINTYEQHRYVADLRNYIQDLGDLTPLTWSRLEDIPDNGPFILKGETNSKKSYWKTDMFAENKREASVVYGRLLNDTLISQQNIYIRQYIPLKSYMNSIIGMPVTEEYRFFCLYGKIISSGYYWQNYIDDLDEKPNPNNVPKEFLDKVISKIKNKVNFVVIDIARTLDNNWIVVELNDGMQSGLSCNNPDTLYKNLREELERKYG